MAIAYIVLNAGKPDQVCLNQACFSGLSYGSGMPDAIRYPAYVDKTIGRPALEAFAAFLARLFTLDGQALLTYTIQPYVAAEHVTCPPFDPHPSYGQPKEVPEFIITWTLITKGRTRPSSLMMLTACRMVDEFCAYVVRWSETALKDPSLSDDALFVRLQEVHVEYAEGAFVQPAPNSNHTLCYFAPRPDKIPKPSRDAYAYYQGGTTPYVVLTVAGFHERIKANPRSVFEHFGPGVGAPEMKPVEAAKVVAKPAKAAQAKPAQGQQLAARELVIVRE